MPECVCGLATLKELRYSWMVLEDSGKEPIVPSVHELTSPVCQPAGTSPILYFHWAL